MLYWALMFLVVALVAAIFGFGGAFFSLAISKWAAKRSTGMQMIVEPRSDTERWLLATGTHGHGWLLLIRREWQARILSGEHIFQVLGFQLRWIGDRRDPAVRADDYRVRNAFHSV